MTLRLADQLRRFYYFAEAMAFYEASYEPALARLSQPSSGIVEALSAESRSGDRPLTWVPIVWHATPLSKFAAIVDSGNLKPPVSFTELPIGELDRIRLRKPGTKDQVAIGFPRAFLATKGIAPVLYTKYNPALTEALTSVLKERPALEAQLRPFLETNDDVGSMLELRSTQPIELSAAVWLLTTCNRGPEGRERPYVPELEAYQAKWGRIPISVWRRDQLLAQLGTAMYTMTRRDKEGRLAEAIAIGDHYWREACFKPEEHEVRMPAGRGWTLRFQARDDDIAKGFEGPFGFIDVAKRFRRYLSEVAPSADDLPYALFPDLATGA